MSFNTAIPEKLKPFYLKEVEKYKTALKKGDLKCAWHYLERAHIIGQKYPYEHTAIHWKMMLFGFRTKNIKEIVGQIPRLLFGGVKSFVGNIPLGNPGGAGVPSLKPFPIASDLEEILDNSKID